eukprot:TRINITY_DN38878_c0_g1_i1.p1 TRINITY_DN38878_c0_g1~~TRINITY_DN38878_c0_g1_i1.p1  ORF type:complete len:556 (-),score=84.47 TRINITY_DN38878_c0_g1_i1:284-1951(-)
MSALGSDAVPKQVYVCLPDAGSDASATTTRVPMSPYDIQNMGRAVPMIWFYDTALDPVKLEKSLQTMLSLGGKAYAALSGRYHRAAPEESGSSIVAGINLSNAGVWFEVEEDFHSAQKFYSYLLEFGSANSVDDEISSLKGKQEDSHRVVVFERNVQSRFFPQGALALMDPDQGRVDAPLMAVKVTLGRNQTAIGVLMQHGVVDADSMVQVMTNWAGVYSGQDSSLKVVPDSESREKLLPRSEGQADGVTEKPANLDMLQIVPAAEHPRVPAFAPLMPTIRGTKACRVTIARSQLIKWRDEAKSSTDRSDLSISQDDVLTARVWRAMAIARCGELDLSKSEELGSLKTSICRACNFRSRFKDPAVGPGYFANGVVNLFTTLPLGEVLLESESDCKSIGRSAQDAKLAEILRKQVEIDATSESIRQRADWLTSQNRTFNCRTQMEFDKNALSFVMSSWMFDWPDAAFESFPNSATSGLDKETDDSKNAIDGKLNFQPVHYDHACHVPIVSVFVPVVTSDFEPSKTKETNLKELDVAVYFSGSDQALKTFCEELMRK